jgi:(2Fe-2S) ferredoxin
MNKPTYHLLVCNSFRLSGEPQGVCNKKGAPSLLQCLEEGIADRGIDAQVSSCGCLKVCDRGPAMVVYPQGAWYGNLDNDKIEEILDALEEGNDVAEYLI